MGMDPVTIGLGISAASGLYGAFTQNKSNQRAQDQAQQNFGAQQAQHKQLTDLLLPYLQSSGQGIDSFIGGRGGSDFNSGQDGLMQMLRNPDSTGALTRAASGNTQFDTSKLFDSIRAQSGQDLGDQIAAQRGSTGSLGQRFGSANLRNEALLRSRAVVGQNAAYTQAGQSAFEAAQNRAVAAGGSIMDSQRGYAGLIGQLLGQKNQNTSSLLGILGGQNPSQQQIIPQTNGYPEAAGDIGNLAILYPFLRQMQQPAAPKYGSIADQFRPSLFPSY